MGKQFDFSKVHIVHGRPWRNAVIKLLEPRSPYRPWTNARGISSGDVVVIVLDTTPRSVVAALNTGGAGRDVDGIDVLIDRANVNGLIEGDELALLSELESLPDDAVFLKRRRRQLLQQTFSGYESDDAFGHSSLAAARLLLGSRGRCTACEVSIDLTFYESRDHIHVRTVDEPVYPPFEAVTRDRPNVEADAKRPYGAHSIAVKPWNYHRSFPDDWPAVLCDFCFDNFRAEGFTSFVDFRFSFNPQCPKCSAFRAMSAMYGMPVRMVGEPWVVQMGCVERSPRWVCGCCGHEW